MKIKRFLVIVLALLLCFSLAACGNYQTFDTTRTFNWAIIQLPDGVVVSGKVQSWRDYEDGDQLQVKINGITYLVHSENAVLINE